MQKIIEVLFTASGGGSLFTVGSLLKTWKPPPCLSFGKSPSIASIDTLQPFPGGKAIFLSPRPAMASTPFSTNEGTVSSSTFPKQTKVWAHWGFSTFRLFPRPVLVEPLAAAFEACG